MRAAIYCRISRDKTGEQAGVERQLQDCENLVSAQDWILVDRYVDNDISATSGKARPHYQRLLADVNAGLVDAIVCWHPDRLYRKLRDLEELITAIEARDVVMRSVRHGEVDLSTPTGRMVARILASVATAEGETKSDRWRRSIRQRREKGQAPGWGPRLFGYTREGLIDPTEAALIRTVATALVEGVSVRQVTKQLNDRGITTTKGNAWSTQALTALMQNARLAGHSTLNGDTVGVGQWEPILTDETFQQVQSVFAVRRGTAPTAPRVSLLVGVLACGECGTMLTSGRLSKRKGEAVGRRVYRCPRPPRADGCGKVAGMAEPVEEIVEAFARARLSDPKVREAVTRLAASAGDNAAEVVELEDRLAELEAQLDAPGVPVAAILRAMDRTRERIEELRAAVVSPTPLPRVGEWPADLRRRRALVDIALTGHSLHLDPAPGRSNRFQPERVRIEPA